MTEREEGERDGGGAGEKVRERKMKCVTCEFEPLKTAKTRLRGSK